MQAGILKDPYTDRTISFTRGGEALVDIDHVVSLGNAWETGAQQLSDEDRRRFANDPLNLLAVDGPANRRKGDADAATWLPPNKAFRCSYVARQTAVKTRYRLWVTAAERSAISAVLSSCPAQPLPAGVPAAVPPVPPAGPAVSYESCSEVKAAGAAPITPEDAGWDAKFDGDGDGVGCTS